MERKILLLALTAFSSMPLLFASGGTSNDAHVVNVQAAETHSIDVSGTTINLSIAGYTAGTSTQTGTSHTDNSGRIDLTSNASEAHFVKVKADTMPTGVTLALSASGGTINAGDPAIQPSASSIAAVSTSDQTLYSNIAKVTIDDAVLTYTLTIPPQTGEISLTPITLTFTITAS